MSNASIVYTHWAENDERSHVMRISFESLLNTTKDVEIIVCDNGGSYADSQYFLSLCDKGMVASYTRFRENMHFSYARNDALRRASRDFIAVVDNDIFFTQPWLEECISWLNQSPGKYLATPIRTDNMNRYREERWNGEVNGWRLNFRAGSNVWVMRRKDFEAIGYFDIVGKAGSKWCDRYTHLGYCVGVMPVSKAVDMCFRRGYDWKTLKPRKQL